MCPPGGVCPTKQGEQLNSSHRCFSRETMSGTKSLWHLGGAGGGKAAYNWALLPEPPVCLDFRIGTREVHNKLEKNRCVCVSL